jgi:hypothetical protein
MHAKRLLVALVALPVLLALLFRAPAWVFGLVITPAAVLAAFVASAFAAVV